MFLYYMLLGKINKIIRICQWLEFYALCPLCLFVFSAADKTYFHCDLVIIFSNHSGPQHHYS